MAPAELEGLLLGHSAVAEAAVIGVRTVSGDELPRAYVVLCSQKDRSEVSETDIIEFITPKVSYYKRLTGGVHFVSSLPRNANGKLLRRLLREQANQTRPKL